MKSEPVIVRPFQKKDREAVRAICRRTGQKGNPTRLFFEDEEIVPVLFADYYMDYEPGSCFVAEVDGRVVGYHFACLDTRRYHRYIVCKAFPRLCFRVFRKVLTLQYREKQTYETLWWIVTRSWQESFSPPLDQYPAHVHANIDSAYRGQGILGKLIDAWRRYAVQKRVRGAHVVIREPEGHNEFSAYLCRERNYTIAEIKRNTVWERVTGTRWHTKLLVCDYRPYFKKKADASFEH